MSGSPDPRLTTLAHTFAAAAHDLKNTLATVVGTAQQLRRSTADPAHRAALALLEQEAGRAAAIVRDVLAFSRQGAAAARQPVELNALVREVAATPPAWARGSAATVELALAPSPLTLDGDAAQLAQLLHNLLANAHQALAGGGGGAAEPRIVVRTAGADGEALLEVADNGPGIADAELPHLWTPFRTTRAAAGGTGLGLAVVRGIAHAHGGRVRVESRPGAGARFQVLLPLPDARAAGPLDVLVVDVDAGRAAAAVRLLAARGHAVLAAHDAAEALRVAGMGRFDVVVVEEAMVHHGAPLLHHLRGAAGCRDARWVLTGDPVPDAPATWGPGAPPEAVRLRRPHEPAGLWRAVESR